MIGRISSGLVVAAAALTGLSAAGGNLVPNGDFESCTADGRLQGWSFRGAGGIWKPAPGRGVDASVALEWECGDAEAPRTYAARQIDLAAGEAYTVEVDISIDGVLKGPYGKGAGVHFERYDSDGKWLGGTYTEEIKTTGGKWRRMSAVSAPVNAKTAKVVARLQVSKGCTGKVRFDNFRVSKLKLGNPKDPSLVPYRYSAGRANTNRMVWIDAMRRARVDGKPFFPLGLYGGIGEKHIGQLRDGPFNAVIAYGAPDRQALDRAQANGIKVISGVNHVFAFAKERPRGVETPEGERRWLERYVQEVKNHPALLAWYAADEPPVTRLPELVSRRDLLEKLDPEHPVWCVYNHPELMRHYVPGFDVAGTDPYPVYDGGDIGESSRWTRMTLRDSGGGRAVWMVPQIFAWGHYSRKGGVPSREEIRNQTWQCIAEGATGIIYFKYGDLLDNSDTGRSFEDRWADVTNVAWEVRTAFPLLLSGEPAPKVTSSVDTVCARAFAKDGQVRLLLVNASREAASAEVEIDLPGCPVLRADLAPLEVRLADLADMRRGAPAENCIWDANVLAWKFDEARGRAAATGVDDMAVLATGRFAKVDISAEAAPLRCRSKDWSTFGIGITDDDENYWRLSLVQSPRGKDGGEGRRFFELCEMREGRWHAQNRDRLPCAGGRQDATWNYGETYRLSLKLDGAGIRGEAADRSGRILYAARFSFPKPAADGSVRAVVCGRPSLHTKGFFAGEFSAIAADCVGESKPQEAKIPPPRYSSESFVPGISEKPTGFFRTVKRPDGKWWAIDPLGRGTVLLGVNHVSYQGMWSLRTMRSIHRETNLRRFPDRSDWVTNTIESLKSWGFNMLGGGSDEDLRRRGLLHAYTLQMGEAACREGVPAEFYICPNERRPCSSFPNVFHPDFPKWCDYVARKKCVPSRDDPWLLGYFIDNELAWWGRGMLDTGLFDAVAKLPDSHSAKKAEKRFVDARFGGKVTVEAKLAFLRLAAERYFAITSAAIRRADPNHLVLGARFAGMRGAHPVVWETAGKYCDVITFNCYPRADLDRNTVRLGRNEKSEKVTDAFDRLYALTRRPILITEWSFPALDTGRPCSHGAGQRFRTQALRAKASELFARTMLALPYVLGYDYFMWVDQPAAGLSDAFPEDCNYGLISEEGRPYKELTTMFARLHSDIGAARSAPLPESRQAPPPKSFTANEAARLLGISKDAVFTKEGGSYSLSDHGGMELEGSLGNRDIFSAVKIGGSNVGRFTLMLCDKVRGNSRWRNLSKVTRAEWRGGLLEVAAEGGEKDERFMLTVKIAPLSGSGRFLCNLVEARNLGEKPLEISSFLFRQYVDYAHDKMQVMEFKSAPDLWQAPDADAWFRKKDKAFFGGFTRSADVVRFQYFTSNGGRIQHPDAQFEPRDLKLLRPGEAYRPKSSVWMVSVCAAEGGREAWERMIEELAGKFRQ